MNEKKNSQNSYLNPRSVVTSEMLVENSSSGVQTETLTQATVKINSDLAAFSNPYSILTAEYSEVKTSTVSFVVDPVEFSDNEVKLPQTIKDPPREEIIEEVVEEKPKSKAKAEAKEQKLSEIPIAEIPTQAQAPEVNDYDILNNLAKYQNAQPEVAASNAEVNIEVPKDFEVKSKESQESINLEKLNELQADEVEAKTSKNKNTDSEIKAVKSGLEGLLAELSAEENSSGQIGMG